MAVVLRVMDGGRIAVCWHAARPEGGRAWLTFHDITTPGRRNRGAPRFRAITRSTRWLAGTGRCGANEARFLHHHGRAVLLVAGRQRAPDRRDGAPRGEQLARVGRAAAEALLHHLVCDARALRRGLRRLDAEGPGHADHQLREDRRLRPALLDGASAAVV